MPEIAEVARTVYYIRKHLVGKTLAKVTAYDDANVYGKVGTSAAEFQKHMSGKKIVDAGQQGKYFWMIMSSPPHPVMHFGMSGWLKMKSEDTYYNKSKSKRKEGDWPPQYCKFLLETKPEKGEEAFEAAFVDTRRFARIRLVDCPGAKIRQVSPLKENGPDPVIDKDIVTVDWLMQKCRSKKVPIKAMLLDQAVISGIGNWVGDEIMYNAKMHPEQYCNTLSDEQIVQLHKSIHYICSTAVDLLADSDKFPQDWLFKHRWGKGRKLKYELPNGEKYVYLTVGGRTSAVVPSVQKKTGPVAKEMDEAVEPAEGESEEETEKKPPRRGRATGRKRKATETEDEESEAEEEEASEDLEEESNGENRRIKPVPQKKGRGKKVKAEQDEKLTDHEDTKSAKLPNRTKKETVNNESKPVRGRKKVDADEKPVAKAAPKQNKKADNKPAAENASSKKKATTTKAQSRKASNEAKDPESGGRRRSTRLSGM